VMTSINHTFMNFIIISSSSSGGGGDHKGG